MSRHRTVSTEYKKNSKILKATESICAICGSEVLKKVNKYHPLSEHIDHIIPVSKGGSDSLENLQFTHRKCNMKKYNKLTTTPYKINNNIKRQEFPQIF